MATENAIDLNGVRCTSLRVVFLWRGAWWAEADLDPDSSPVTAADIPSGAAVITVTPAGQAPIVLRGTVDPTDAGRFVSTVRVHILAGGGGWSTPVDGQHFQNPNGVSSLTVEQATAALVGETVNDPVPISLGTDWVREGSADAPRSAAEIFADRQWYVDPSGVTQVAAWPATPQDPSVEILSWDPTQQRGEFAADVLVVPGTVLTDSRFDGPITVRDVEQTFTRDGCRATVWCSSTEVTRLVSALTNMVRAFGKLGALVRWTYRIVTQNGATFDLQAVPNPDGTKPPVPDLKAVKVWPGMSGLSCQATPSSNVGVCFLNGSLANPIVVDFDGATLPQSVTLDAQDTVDVGPSASAVNLAGGGTPVAGVGNTVYVVGAFTGTTSTGIPMTGVVTGVGTIQDGSGKVATG